MFGYSWFSTTEQSLITRLHYYDEDNLHLSLKMYASVTDNVIDTVFGNFMGRSGIRQGAKKYISNEELN